MKRSSRRGFLQESAGVLAGAAATGLFSREAAAQENNDRDDARTLDRLERANADRARRILLKGGTVISMDPKVGNLERADVLIEGTKISSIAPDLSASARDGKTIVVDAKDMIVSPGFCDPHIHSWEGQLGRFIPNANGVPDDKRFNYNVILHEIIGPHYRPQDMYIGNLMTALSCIEAGITTFCDNSHNTRSAAHADSAAQGLIDSGCRAVYGSGNPRFGKWDEQWPQDLGRVKKKYFASDDQLTTLRMFVVGGPATEPANFRVARDLDLWISFDGGAGSAMLPGFYKEGLLVGKESYNHGGGIPDTNWQLIRDRGAHLNVCPRSDTQFFLGGNGRGYNALQDALDHGVRPGLSNDNPTAYAIDMFTEMRTVYFIQHAMAQYLRSTGNKNPPAPVTVRDVLEFATIRGAECCGLDRKVGSLTPGKEADIIMIRTEPMRLSPTVNAIGTMVQGASVGDVDAVFIAGKLKKWRGRTSDKLLGQTLSKVRQMGEESRNYLSKASGWSQDIFSD
jgi:cytosine/adenosine deaminase-related metal-dependent hydrolase